MAGESLEYQLIALWLARIYSRIGKIREYVKTQPDRAMEELALVAADATVLRYALVPAEPKAPAKEMEEAGT